MLCYRHGIVILGRQCNAIERKARGNELDKGKREKEKEKDRMKHSVYAGFVCVLLLLFFNSSLSCVKCD